MDNKNRTCLIDRFGYIGGAVYDELKKRTMTKFEDVGSTGKFCFFWHWHGGGGEHFKGVEFSLDTLDDNPLYICDDPSRWASMWCNRQCLYLVVAWVENPKRYFNSDRRYESDLCGEIDVDQLKKDGHDCMLYTYKEQGEDWGGEVRQGKLLHPKDQIVDVLQVLEINGEHLTLHSELALPTYEVIMLPKEWNMKLGDEKPIAQRTTKDGVVLLYRGAEAKRLLSQYGEEPDEDKVLNNIVELFRMFDDKVDADTSLAIGAF